MLFKLLFLDHAIPVDGIKRMLLLHVSRLHVHVVDIVALRILHCSPVLGNLGFESLLRDPEQVFVVLDIDTNVLGVFKDLYSTVSKQNVYTITSRLISLHLLINALVALIVLDECHPFFEDFSNNYIPN